VLEVTDDTRLDKADRRRLQVERSADASHSARLVKLADKICNLRDMLNSPPASWDLGRRREYFDWARQVMEQIRGTNRRLEAVFDKVFARRP
jgi:guanosine-3',5'-bis(diphosphate) 3'-pyrophosphohydrolase